MKTKKSITIIGLTITFLIIGLFALSWIYKTEFQTFLTETAKAYGLIVIVALSFLLDFIPQYISPHMLILNSAIIKIPIIETSIFVSIGGLIAGIVGFELGRKYSKLEYDTENRKKIKRYLDKYKKPYMAIAAISPLPYSPLIFGSLKIPRKDFYIYGLFVRVIGYLGLGLILSWF